MMRVAPPWYGKTYGHDPAGWEEALEQCRRTLVAWARRGRYGTYTELTNEVPAIGWPEGAYTHQGRQIGMLLGHVSVTEWLEGRPLLSAMAVQATELTPATGFFDMARARGEFAGQSSDEELVYWLKEFKACCEYQWPDR